MTPALVSTILTVYNGERFVAQALRSALEQTYREVEIIIVNDGSTDGSARIIEQFVAEFPDRVQAIHQDNQGVSSARNRAIKAARGAYLALLDHDDVWLPHHIAACVAILDQQPDVGLVHGDIEKIDIAGNSQGRYPRHWHCTTEDTFTTLLLRQEHVSAPTAVFRRDLVDRVGGFDTAFNRVTGEDRDLWLRLAEISRLHYCTDVHARYRLHASNISGSPDRNQRGRITLIDKYTRSHPERGALRKRALAGSHCSHGDELLHVGQRALALRAYVNALIERPIQLRALKSIARSLFRSSAR